MKIIAYFLVALHFFLGFWALGGFVEMIVSKVPWKPFTNPEFPQWVLLLHWSSILFASSAFLYGYFSHWKYTPKIMTIGYGFMAMVCVIETFGFMTSKMKYLATGAEFFTCEQEAC
jgi:hypothetical protein